MKSASTEILEKEYDDKVFYGFLISAAIVQGKYELAFQFLRRNTDRKGIKLTICSYLYYYIDKLRSSALLCSAWSESCSGLHTNTHHHHPNFS